MLTPLSVSLTLFERYRAILFPSSVNDHNGEMSAAHLLWMCNHAAQNAAEWPIDKTSRWLGYVQGVMVAKGLLSVSAEREFSRPLFHEAYRHAGLKAPETAERGGK